MIDSFPSTYFKLLHLFLISPSLCSSICSLCCCTMIALSSQMFTEIEDKTSVDVDLLCAEPFFITHSHAFQKSFRWGGSVKLMSPARFASLRCESVRISRCSISAIYLKSLLFSVLRAVAWHLYYLRSYEFIRSQSVHCRNSQYRSSADSPDLHVSLFPSSHQLEFRYL